MVINWSPMSSVNAYNTAKVEKVKTNNNSLFAYMNAGLKTKNDGTQIAYMNANNSSSGNSGSSSSGGSTVCIA